MDRPPWSPERRRKQPSLYDQYLDEERPAHRTLSVSAQATPSSPSGRLASTIRTVTPDALPDASLVSPTSTQAFERDFLGLSTSPTSPRWHNQEQLHDISDDTIARRESSDLPRRGNPGSPQMPTARRRTVTGHGAIPDVSGRSSGATESRSRLGSLQSSDSTSTLRASSQGNGFGGGLPSSVSQPSFSARHLYNNPAASSPARASPGPLPTPNARRTLHLMKTLCGRMSGNVSFRRLFGTPWTSVYCFIQDVEGSLVYEAEFGQGSHKTLVSDLRGCQVRCKVDEEGSCYIDVTVPRSLQGLQLRLATQSELESWYAALLCWQPMQPRGLHNRMVKPQSTHLSVRPGNDSRQNSEASILKEAPVIKVGQLIYWDNEITYTETPAPAPAPRQLGSRTPSVAQPKVSGVRWWRRVSCTLRENGELKFFTDAEDSVLNTVHLSRLSRCAIQRLDPSVLDTEWCIAIYPQYTCGPLSTVEDFNPIFLSAESFVLYEVWFVLLRAFTIPQLYGPSSSSSETDGADRSQTDSANPEANGTSDMFRMERGLSLFVTEAKLNKLGRMAKSPDMSAPTSSRRAPSPKPEASPGYYIEVHLDAEIRGKTRVNYTTSNPFWSQQFDYQDLPAIISSASVFLRQRTNDGFGTPQKVSLDNSKVNNGAHGVRDPKTAGTSSGYTGATEDMTLGKVEIVLDELDSQSKSEQWWPITDDLGQEIGTILIRAKAEETVILMRQEYESLHKILHAFDNGLTPVIFTTAPSELRRLSESLVNIFQVSNRSTDWLMALVEDEIDGLGKETPLSKARYIARSGSVEPDGANGKSNDRELVVRDMNKNAALEANLLFRGNTLLTKALDIHMRRIGAGYLQFALGPVIRAINDKDPNCEVDPNRLTDKHEVDRNWRQLKRTTGEVWEAIRSSAQKCPVDLRFIFRHIRNCAEDRYGDFLRTVSYSSVSGFLFLRFFCPAVLSPKLFGLLKDDPKPRAKRTFVLVAKSLQTLANMAHFGSKESWMEPMNNFLNINRDQFKKFIEEVCFVAHPPTALSESSASYSTPKAIKDRLPSTSREGFPSLPYLLDEGREYANLIEIWLQASTRLNIDLSGESPTAPIRQFDDICKRLANRTRECLARAETAERPSSELSDRWEGVIDSLSLSQPDSPLPRIDTSIPSPTLTQPMVPTSDSETDGPAPSVVDSDGASAASTSPSSAHRRAQQHDWTTAPDGGASAAAAVLGSSVVAADRNPRAGLMFPANMTVPGLARSPPSPLSDPRSASVASAVWSTIPAAEERPGSALSRAGSETATAGEDTALPPVVAGREKRGGNKGRRRGSGAAEEVGSRGARAVRELVGFGARRKKT